MMERLERKRDFWALLLVVALVLSLLPNQVVVNAGEGKKSSVTRRAVRADADTEVDEKDGVIHLGLDNNGELDVKTTSGRHIYDGTNHALKVTTGSGVYLYDGKSDTSEDIPKDAYQCRVKFSTEGWSQQKQYDSYKENVELIDAKKTELYYAIYNKENTVVTSGSASVVIEPRPVNIQWGNAEDIQYDYNGKSHGPDLNIENIEMDNGENKRGVLEKDVNYFEKSISIIKENDSEELFDEAVVKDNLKKPIDAGNYKAQLKISDEVKSNYNLNGDADKTFTIKPCELKVNWGDLDKKDHWIYGEEIPAPIVTPVDESVSGCVIEVTVTKDDKEIFNEELSSKEQVLQKIKDTGEYKVSLSKKEEKNSTNYSLDNKNSFCNFSIVPNIKDAVMLEWGKKINIKDVVVCDEDAWNNKKITCEIFKKYKVFFEMKNGKLVPKYCKKKIPANLNLSVSYNGKELKTVGVKIRIPKPKVKIKRTWKPRLRCYRYTFKYNLNKQYKTKKAGIKVKIVNRNSKSIKKYIKKYISGYKSNKNSYIQFTRSAIKKNKKFTFKIYASYGKNKSKVLTQKK